MNDPFENNIMKITYVGILPTSTLQSSPYYLQHDRAIIMKKDSPKIITWTRPSPKKSL